MAKPAQKNEVRSARAVRHSFTLTDNETGESWEFPTMHGTIGPKVIDTRKLYSQAGVFTYDPGFASTASCSSEITYIDGDAGVLLHRGYAIDDLAKNTDYMDVCYLLLHGELPSPEEKSEFDININRHTMLHEQLVRFYSGFVRSAHPMAIMVGVVGALSAFYHDSTDINDPMQRMIAAHRLIAKMPTIGAYAYKYSLGQPFPYPNNKLSYSENILRLMFSAPTDEYEVNPVLARAMNSILILHADHEQNASANTMRAIGSSLADPYSALAGAIGSLYGPLHGGANEAVIRMLEEIESVDNIPKFIENVKSGADGVRLMGFGHRVYKVEDPRVRHLRDRAHALAMEKGNPEWFQILTRLEDESMKPLRAKGVFVNVDFYAGAIYYLLGIPEDLFIPMFALGRIPGWTLQCMEQYSNNILIRPLAEYTGSMDLEYVPFEDRL